MARFKGNCESDFMKESARVYRKYVAEEKKFRGMIDDINSLGDLTSEAKKRETKKMQQEISSKRAGMKTRLKELEEDFANWAYEFADLTGMGLSRQLVTALNSGIEYTPQELLYLAKMAGNDEADSRLLRDYAKAHGYELKNYVSPEQKIEKFHKMNDLFGKFADDEGSKNWFRIPDNEIDIFVGNQLTSVEVLPENMEIQTIAKSIDEEIQRDLNKRKAEEMKEVDKNGEFLKGFGVEPQETDPEYYEPEEVTEEEREKVREISEKMGYEPSKKETEKE